MKYKLSLTKTSLEEKVEKYYIKRRRLTYVEIEKHQIKDAFIYLKVQPVAKGLFKIYVLI